MDTLPADDYGRQGVYFSALREYPWPRTGSFPRRDRLRGLWEKRKGVAVARRNRGSVREHKGVWYAIVTVPDRMTGKGKQAWFQARKHEGENSRGAAERLRTRKLAELDEGRFVATSSMRLSEWLDVWLEDHEVTLRPSTAAGYRTKINAMINPRIGDVKLQTVTADTLRAFYDDCSKTYAWSGVQLSKAILTRALRDAVLQGLLPRDPSVGVKVRRPDDDGTSAVQRAWGKGDLQAFIEGVADDRLYPLWLLLATTGMRREEALGQRWEQVSLEGGSLFVGWVRTVAGAEAVEGPPKTKRSRRHVSLPDITVEALREWRQVQGRERAKAGRAWGSRADCDHDHVFTDEAGSPLSPSRVTKSFAAHVKRLELPHRRLYDLRHTHATLLLAEGVPVKTVSERLGHTSTAFTMDTYVEVTPQMRDEAASVTEGLFG